MRILIAEDDKDSQKLLVRILQKENYEVVVADDGHGVDLNKIREKIQKRGLPEPKDERELLRMLENIFGDGDLSQMAYRLRRAWT